MGYSSGESIPGNEKYPYLTTPNNQSPLACIDGLAIYDTPLGGVITTSSYVTVGECSCVSEVYPRQ